MGFLILCFVLSKSLWAQTSSEGETLRIPKIFGIRYSVSVRWEPEEPEVAVQGTTWPRVCDFQNLLKEPEVLLEIETSELQKKKLRKFVREMDEKAKGWIHPIRFDEQKFSIARKEAEAELRKILASRQLRRLNQITNRINFRAIGGYNGLVFAGKGLGFSLSAKEKTDLENTLKEFQKGLQKKFTDRMAQTVSRIYHPLTGRQKKRIKKPSSADLQPDIFLAQLQYCIGLEGEIGTTSSQRFRQLVASRPQFRSIGDGRFTAKSCDQTTFVLSSVTDRSKPSGKNELEISEEQWDELLLVRENYSQKLDECQMAWNRSGGTKADFERLEKGYQQVFSAKEKEIEKLLSGSQQSQARKVFAKLEMAKYGLIADLLVGDLGRDLEVSDQQREQIRRTVKKELKAWKKLAFQWEFELEKRANKVLSVETKKQLKKKFGPKITYLTPGLSQFAIDPSR